MSEWLAAHAARRADAVALRCKRRGLWRTQSWRALDASVTALARGLAAHGFVPGDRLLVDAAASPELYRVALAVLRLGGAIVSGAPRVGAPDPSGTAPSAALGARFAFADDDTGRARLAAALGGRGPWLGLVRDGADASEASAAWLSLDAIDAGDSLDHVAGGDRGDSGDGAAAALPPWPSPQAVAIIAERAERSAVMHHPTGGESLTQADLADSARELLAAAGIGPRQRVLASQGLELSTQLASVLGAWLVGGFALSLAESAATEDYDRRELGPHIVLGNDRGYEDLVARTLDALPSGTGVEARWLSRSLDGSGVTGRLARRLLVRRLRDVVGFGQLQRAVALDGASAAGGDDIAIRAMATGGFERLFGAVPLAWPAPNGAATAVSASEAEVPALNRSAPILSQNGSSPTMVPALQAREHSAAASDASGSGPRLGPPREPPGASSGSDRV